MWLRGSVFGEAAGGYRALPEGKVCCDKLYGLSIRRRSSKVEIYTWRHCIIWAPHHYFDRRPFFLGHFTHISHLSQFLAIGSTRL